MMKLVILTNDPFMDWVFERIGEQMPSLLKKKANPSLSLNMAKIPTQIPTRSRENSPRVDDVVVDMSNMARHICTHILDNILNEVIYMDLQDDFIISPYLMRPAQEQIISVNHQGQYQHRIEAFVHCGVIILPDMIEQNVSNCPTWSCIFRVMEN